MMFKVKVNDFLLLHCQNQIKKHNFGQRNQANGNKEQQLTGVIGESVVRLLLNENPVNGESGFDGGIDITFNDLTIDVKTMGRTTDVKPNYINNFFQLQDYFDPDIYIFCSYHKTKNELTVCGWIDKKTFTEKRRFYPQGSERKRNDGSTFKFRADNYEIDNSDLNNVNSPNDLIKQLTLF